MAGPDATYGEKVTNSAWFCLKLGFFAGLIWGCMRWVIFTFSFTNVLPGFLAVPLFGYAFMFSWWGHLVGVGVFTLFSIVAAFLYKWLLGRLRGPWPGAIYGVAWYALIILLVAPLTGMAKPLNQIGWDTLITELCFFVVWGLFIGYTIAFEFTDEVKREPIQA